MFCSFRHHGGGYQDPNQHSQYSDQYSHSHSSYSHSAPPVQSPNNNYMNGSGYGQSSSYGGNNAQTQMSYTQPAEYDHSSGGGYQDYKYVFSRLFQFIV